MLKWGKDKKPEKPEGRADQPKSSPRAAEAPLPNYGRSQNLRAAAPVEKKPTSLPQLLLSQGQLSEEQLRAAQAKQAETGAFLGEILIEEGILDEKSLLSFIAKHCKIPHLSLLDYLIEADILKLVPKEICLQYRLLPIDRLGSNLTVAMVNPLNTEALDKVRECCPELRIKPILCAHNHFTIVTQKLFHEGPAEGPAELSATSLGLRLPTVQKAAPPLPPPEPVQEEEEEIPEALEVIPDPVAQETPVAPEINEDEVLDEVFHQETEAEASPPPAAAPEAPAAASLMQEMANVMMDSMRDTYAMLARRMELFRNLDPEEVAKLFSKGLTEEYPADTLIFKKGDLGEKVYAILGGEVVILDDDRCIATLGRGDMFGEMALVSNEPRSATVRTTTNTSVLALSLDTIHHVMTPEVAVQVLSNIVVTLSARLRQANAQLAARDTPPAS